MEDAGLVGFYFREFFCDGVGDEVLYERMGLV